MALSGTASVQLSIASLSKDYIEIQKLVVDPLRASLVVDTSYDSIGSTRNR
jgi:hypothetical protein